VRVGDLVRIERDETRYPSKGTWPRFRGKTGTIVEINVDEYGVCFGKVIPRKSRPGSFDWDSADVAWFQPYELSVISRAASVAVFSGTATAPEGKDTGDAVTHVHQLEVA
jgi:hypothetical protein